MDAELYPVAKYKLKEIPMISKEISIKIGKVIKEIWMKNIPKDLSEGYIINEDCLKMALCYHLRRKLSTVLKENDLRIYTEKYFPDIKKKPDIIIAQLRDEYEEKSLYASVREEDVVSLFELKFTSETAQSTADWMKDDLKKLKDYVQKSKFQCPLYFAVVKKWLDGRKRLLVNYQETIRLAIYV